MKKIFVLGSLIMLLATAASAQGRVDRMRSHRVERGFNDGSLTRPEKHRLQRDEFRYRTEKRRAHRDGRVNRHEKRRLNKMKRHERREMFRLKHNGRRRSL